MKTYEVKIFRKNQECETIRGLTSTQMVVLDKVFSHYGVSYKRFTYDDNHLESVDWIEAPDLLAALERVRDRAKAPENRGAMTQLQACRFLDNLLAEIESALVGARGGG